MRESVRFDLCSKEKFSSGWPSSFSLQQSCSHPGGQHKLARANIRGICEIRVQEKKASRRPSTLSSSFSLFNASKIELNRVDSKSSTRINVIKRFLFRPLISRIPRINIVFVNVIVIVQRSCHFHQHDSTRFHRFILSHADAADFRRITHHFARVPHPDGSTSLRVRILRVRV